MSSADLTVLRIYLIVSKLGGDKGLFNRLYECIHEYTHKHARGKTFLIKNVTRIRKFGHDLGNCAPPRPWTVYTAIGDKESGQIL